MDGLEFNKLAAAFLIALLLLKSGQEISNVLISPKKLKENEHAYIVEGVGARITATQPTGPLPIEPLLANADIKRGMSIARQCVQCHTLEKGGRDGIGPNLYGVVGDAMARNKNYPYSRVLESKGEKWTFENLNKLLYRPRDLLNGTKMAFAGLRKEQDRADLVAYLNTLSDQPLELPKADVTPVVQNTQSSDVQTEPPENAQNGNDTISNA